MNTLELASRHPEAFNALPEPYQNDDCLEFEELNDVIYCEPKDDQVNVLGNWLAKYNPELKIWEMIN